MNNKNGVLIGALVLALVVGGFAFMSNRNAQKAPEVSDMGSTLNPGTGTTDTGTNGTDTASTDDEATPASGTPVTGTTDTTAPTGTTVPEYHVVKANETLRDIAKLYYNDPAMSAEIEKLNELTNPNHITVNQKLKLPQQAQETSGDATQQTEPTQAEQEDDSRKLTPAPANP